MVKFPYYYLANDYICNFEISSNVKGVPAGAISFHNLQQYLKKSECSYFTDLRIPVFSLLSEDVVEKDLILNYSISYSIASFGNDYIKLYLNFGLIPFAFIPTSHIEYADYIENKLLEEGIHPYKILGKYLHEKTNIQTRIYDIWVSRMEAADFLQCKPEDVKTVNIFKEVLK